VWLREGEWSKAEGISGLESGNTRYTRHDGEVEVGDGVFDLNVSG
jgi:hypothetical protein